MTRTRGTIKVIVSWLLASLGVIGMAVVFVQISLLFEICVYCSYHHTVQQEYSPDIKILSIEAALSSRYKDPVLLCYFDYFSAVAPCPDATHRSAILQVILQCRSL